MRKDREERRPGGEGSGDDLSTYLAQELGANFGYQMRHLNVSPLWVRVGARLRGGHLDAQIAGGADLDAHPLLAERALLLADIQQRRYLAASYVNLLREYDGPRHRLDSRVPVNLTVVRGCQTQILAVAEALQGALVAIRGVAAARELISDGTGPVYYKYSTYDLFERLCEILTWLRPSALA